MENKLLTSIQQNKGLAFVVLFCFVLLVQQGNAAREYVVGGSNWSVRNGTNTESYNKWAERNRFQINDSLVFIYPPDQDSVLVVTADAYNNCSTDSPLEKFTDGHTVYTFKRSGPFYFISGNKDNCNNNEKIVVVVMADRSGRSSNATTTTPPSSPPSPSPSIETTPTPAPSPPSPVAQTPSPAPSGESPPASAPVPAPTPAPAADHNPPKKNAASSMFVSVGGFLGSAVAASLVLA